MQVEIVRAEQEIARSREQVATSLMALQREITRAADWREWVRRRPAVVLSLAFGLGFLLGRRS